jgi:hypothetical protein
MSYLNSRADVYIYIGYMQRLYDSVISIWESSNINPTEGTTLCWEIVWG